MDRRAWTVNAVSHNFLLRGPIEKIALRAARAAGTVHRARFNRISFKGKTSFLDLVTEADGEAEAAVIRVISRAFPTMPFCPRKAAGRSAQRTSMDHRPGGRHHQLRPRLSSFLRLDRLRAAGTVELGVILDAPRKELFVARRGKGASLNGRPIS